LRKVTAKIKPSTHLKLNLINQNSVIDKSMNTKKGLRQKQYETLLNYSKN